MLQPAASQVESLCLGCNERRPLRAKHKITLSSGQMAFDGECAVCGQAMFKIEDCRQEQSDEK